MLPVGFPAFGEALWLAKGSEGTLDELYRLTFWQYHGKMSFAARDKAIERFADNPNVRVLLASLRCGGCKSALFDFYWFTLY
jgi:hypothetical protein